MSKGLRLGGKSIHSITGPSTYSILLPPKDSTLPIQLLLGDIHRGFDNPCDEDEKNSYSIYEDKFLQLLDGVGKVYPIHFYTESAYGKFMRDIEVIEDGYLFSRLLRNTKNCYGGREVHSYEKECSTTYVNWEHVDARFFENSMEGFIFSYTREFLKEQISLRKESKILTEWLYKFQSEKSFIYDNTITTSGVQFSVYILSCLIEFTQTLPKRKTYRELSYCSMKKIQELQKLHSISNDNRQKEIDREIDNIYIEESGIYSSYSILLDDIVSGYFNMIKIDNSSTKRQLNKLRVAKGINEEKRLVEALKTVFLKNLPYLIKILNALFYPLNGGYGSTLTKIRDLMTYPKYNDNKYYEKIELDFMDVTVTDEGDLKLLANSEKIKNLHDCCQLLLCLVTEFCSGFLDIFYITRVLQSRNPYLSIGYFGDNHVQSIRSFFTEYLGYTILIKSPELNLPVDRNNVSRCIFIEDIDMDEVLESYLTEGRKTNALRNIITLNIERRRRVDSLLNSSFLESLMTGPLKDELPIPTFLQ